MEKDAGVSWSFEELNSIASVLSSFSWSLLSVIQSLMSDTQSWTLQIVWSVRWLRGSVRLRAGSSAIKTDAPYSDFVISEKVVECMDQTEWAQGLNLQALQTEGQLGQTECCLWRWSADSLKGMTEMSWEQNQKYQSNFGDDLEECGGRSCQMQLTGLIRSEDKLCHSQRLRGGHWDMEKCRLHAVAVMVSKLKSVHEFVLVEMFW